ncbi:tRNA (N6-threonylcarbamoyladenosine(37)-N6)-methyltransferase TrmO [cyanobacterium TDX16]|nr:tRNA (N6-threonylcarbamoyladenosine(37)-N6)-methyltransferase TrmO [cyanobacterium TDX16]
MRDLGDAANQGDEGGVRAEIVLEDGYLSAAANLHHGDRLHVLTWLDRADREVLAVHPRDDPTRPLTGVFSTRSPDRPNPIGLHDVTVLATEGTVLTVEPLEVLDGTPVIDLKPILPPIEGR